MFFVWIEYFMPRCFVYEVMKNGAIESFPVSFVLVLDLVLGSFLSFVITAFFIKRQLVRHIREVCKRKL
jgi:hypothetical protein